MPDLILSRSIETRNLARIGPLGLSGLANANDVDEPSDSLTELLSSFESLTPEVIIAVVQLRMKDLDGQIGQIMGSLNKQNETARGLSEKITRLRQLQSAMGEHVDGARMNAGAEVPEEFRTGSSDETIAIDREQQERIRGFAELAGVTVAEGELTDKELSRLSTVPGGRPPAAADLRKAADTLSQVRAKRAAELAQQNTLAGYLEREYGISIGDGRNAVDLIKTKLDELSESLRMTNSNNEVLMLQLQSATQQRTSVIQMGSNLLKSIDEGSDSIVSNLR